VKSLTLFQAAVLFFSAFLDYLSLVLMSTEVQACIFFKAYGPILKKNPLVAVEMAGEV